jgi:hypothetical protein
MTEATRERRPFWHTFWRTPWKIALAVIVLLFLLGCFGVFIQPLYAGNGDGHGYGQGETGQVGR